MTRDRQSQILLSTTTFQAITPAHNIHSHRHNLGEEEKEMLGEEEEMVCDVREMEKREMYK